MKLAEAAATGLPFKRPADKDWWKISKAGYVVHLSTEDAALVTEILPITLENITCDDWEVDEPTVVITSTMFDDVAEQALLNSRIISNSFLGTYSNAETSVVIKYMKHVLFGGNK